MLIEPQLEAFYDQLMDYADALRAAGSSADAGQAGEPQAQPAALAAATGARDRPGRDANPKPHVRGSVFAYRTIDGEGGIRTLGGP